MLCQKHDPCERKIDIFNPISFLIDKSKINILHLEHNWYERKIIIELSMLPIDQCIDESKRVSSNQEHDHYENEHYALLKTKSK